ncbi:hypothetical protein IFM89_002508 [Coptis chinensis]|uniref:Pentatricopeptide repeat-containing protein n=1 Tax=Coptis chinensis TaxID=261450 RepID=A0A835HG76_9MAGN|nr:hypothetical protein IFM89_002508 [Coptis chinensis]
MSKIMGMTTETMSDAIDDVACVYLEEMRKMGWIPSDNLYITVIGACLKKGNVMRAVKLKNEMVKSGMHMNVVVGTRLLKGYCAQGNLQSTLDIFSKMTKSGISPYRVTYAVLCSDRRLLKKHKCGEGL